MYKLRLYIYSNHVPFDPSQKSYEFKSLANLGLAKEKSKSEFYRDFFVFMFKTIDFLCVFGV